MPNFQNNCAFSTKRICLSVSIVQGISIFLISLSLVFPIWYYQGNTTSYWQGNIYRIINSEDEQVFPADNFDDVKDHWADKSDQMKDNTIKDAYKDLSGLFESLHYTFYLLLIGLIPSIILYGAEIYMLIKYRKSGYGKQLRLILILNTIAVVLLTLTVISFGFYTPWTISDDNCKKVLDLKEDGEIELERVCVTWGAAFMVVALFISMLGLIFLFFISEKDGKYMINISGIGSGRNNGNVQLKEIGPDFEDQIFYDGGLI